MAWLLSHGRARFLRLRNPHLHCLIDAWLVGNLGALYDQNINEMNIFIYIYIYVCMYVYENKRPYAWACTSTFCLCNIYNLKSLFKSHFFSVFLPEAIFSTTFFTVSHTVQGVRTQVTSCVAPSKHHYL